MLHKPKHYNQKQHTHEFCRHKEVKLEEQGVCLATATTIQGGVAEVTWQYYLVDADVPPDSDPAFFFSAHSAWCQFEKSSSATIELVRPKLESPEWQNADGTTTKGLVGEVLTMSVTCTDMEEGAGVSFAVHHTGDSIVTATPVAQLGATVSGGKAEVVWVASDTRESGDSDALSFFFAAKAQRVAPIKSANVDVKHPRILSMDWAEPFLLYGKKATLYIKTFEVAEFAPPCTIQLYEKNESIVLLEKNIVLDKENLEVCIEMTFDLDKLQNINGEHELMLYARITECDIALALCRSHALAVRIGGLVL